MAAKKSTTTIDIAAGDNKTFDEIMEEVEDIMRSIEEDVELPSKFTNTFYPKYKASLSNGEAKLDEPFESDLKDLDDMERDKYVFEALTAFISHKYQVRKGRKGEPVTQMTLDDWISEDASQMTRFLHSKDLEFTTLRDDGPTGLDAKSVQSKLTLAHLIQHAGYVNSRKLLSGGTTCPLFRASGTEYVQCMTYAEAARL